MAHAALIPVSAANFTRPSRGADPVSAPCEKTSGSDAVFRKIFRVQTAAAASISQGTGDTAKVPELPRRESESAAVKGGSLEMQDEVKSKLRAGVNSTLDDARGAVLESAPDRDSVPVLDKYAHGALKGHTSAAGPPDTVGMIPGKNSDAVKKTGGNGSAEAKKASDRDADAGRSKKDGASSDLPGASSIQEASIFLAAKMVQGTVPVVTPAQALPSSRTVEEGAGTQKSIGRAISLMRAVRVPASVAVEIDAGQTNRAGIGSAPDAEIEKNLTARKAVSPPNTPPTPVHEAASRGSGTAKSSASNATVADAVKAALNAAEHGLQATGAGAKKTLSGVTAVAQQGGLPNSSAGSTLAAINVGANLTAASHSSADPGAGSAVSVSPYARMDQGSAPIVLHSGVQQVAVGVRDSSLGWVEIRAQNVSGHVDASVLAATSQAQALLSAQLPAMAQFVVQRDVPLGSLAVQQQAVGGFGGSLGGNAGNSGGASQSGANPGGGFGQGGFTGGFGNPAGGFRSSHSNSVSVRAVSGVSRARGSASQVFYEDGGDVDIDSRPVSYINVRA